MFHKEFFSTKAFSQGIRIDKELLILEPLKYHSRVARKQSIKIRVLWIESSDEVIMKDFIYFKPAGRQY